MFTGLVETKNPLLARTEMVGGAKMTFSHTFSELVLGESIALCGACLTVVAFNDKSFDVELSSETLKLTTLGGLQVGTEVNMERSLRVGDRLGGHLVTGHVDGMATVRSIEPEGEMTRVSLEVPADLAPFIATKGSLTVDGVSLTVNSVDELRVRLLVIPHTQAVTTLGRLRTDQKVNLEVDLVARYVERLLKARTSSD